MKSILKIAVEAMITVSLIALLALLVALVYGLLSLLSPAPIQSVIPAEIPMIQVLSPARAALRAAHDEPNYSEMSTRELRPLARDRKIPRWNKLTKSQLIAALSAL